MNMQNIFQVRKTFLIITVIFVSIIRANLRIILIIIKLIKITIIIIEIKNIIIIIIKFSEAAKYYGNIPLTYVDLGHIAKVHETFDFFIAVTLFFAWIKVLAGGLCGGLLLVVLYVGEHK